MSRGAAPAETDPTQTIVARARWLVLLLHGVLIALVFRCAFLQLEHGEELRDDHRKTFRHVERTVARRGRIKDSRGLVLAFDRPVWRVGLDPQWLAGPENLSTDERERRVRQAVWDLDFPELHWRDDRVRTEERALHQLREGSNYVLVGTLKTVPDERAFRAWRRDRAEALDRPSYRQGWTLSLDLERHRPYGVMAAQIVGATTRDGTGITGIELAYDRELRGIDGRRALHRIVGRDVVAGEVADVPVIHGTDLQLTVDARLQAVLEESLLQQIEITGARGGLALVMDPQNGAILAAASTPYLDPERFHDLEEDVRASTELRIGVSRYEPGSTIKGLVLAEALLAGFDPAQRVTDGKDYWRPRRGRTIRDTSKHEPLSIAESVIHSSNIGMARVGQLLGRARLQKLIERFQLTKPVGLEIVGDAWGLTPGRAPHRWRDDTTLSVAYGYEIGTTAVQLARAYCALVNGGRLVTPHLVERGGLPAPRVLPEPVSSQVRATLRRVVEEGTASRLEGPDIGMGGKTGTAKVNADGQYVDGLYRGSFLGFVPWDNPRYLAFALIEEPDPSRGYYGGEVAGPVVREVLGWLQGGSRPRLAGAVKASFLAGRGRAQTSGATVPLAGPDQGSIMPAGNQEGNMGDIKWSAPAAR